MSHVEVVFFMESDGAVPVIDWLRALSTKVQCKLLARIELLAEKGFELRRPHADILRDGIHELRTRHQRVQYRLLYFFYGRTVVLAHGLTKERIVSPTQIAVAASRRKRFYDCPERHTYREPSG
ncbi:MAG: type II toxin-antitoxin system RelE/ParE family toxin [Gemmatimonadales bacterium]